MDRLIAASFAPVTAKKYRRFVPDEAQLQILAKIGSDVLNHLKPLAAACAPMSAIYAIRLQHVAKLPAYVVAGSLRVGDTYVFGDGKHFDGRKVPSESNSSWNGHAWVAVGNVLADISLFRTVYAGTAHPVLAQHVHQEFGKGRGLIIVEQNKASLHGLDHQPQYVLTEEQVEGLYRGAMRLFRKNSC